jgi:hypothetical protein
MYLNLLTGWGPEQNLQNFRSLNASRELSVRLQASTLVTHNLACVSYHVNVAGDFSVPISSMLRKKKTVGFRYLFLYLSKLRYGCQCRT